MSHGALNTTLVLLKPYSGLAFSLMRMVFAFLYLSHGLKWLFGAFGGRPVPLTPLLTLAGVIETIGGALMLLGLFTSWAAIVACCEMVVAYGIAHIPRGSFIPIENGGEITIALCLGFLYIATQGSGPISIESWLRGKTLRA